VEIFGQFRVKKKVGDDVCCLFWCLALILESDEGKHSAVREKEKRQHLLPSLLFQIPH